MRGVLSSQNFQTLQGEGKVCSNGQPVEDSQKHFNIWDQRFQVNWEAPQINEIISDFDFSKEYLKDIKKICAENPVSLNK